MTQARGPAPLEGFFQAGSVAVIGVSSDPSNLGKNIVKNLLTFGYQGEIVSVGMRRDVVFGQRVYLSLEEVDRDIDLAVILTPAKTVPGLLEQCGRKGIRRVVIESAGFSELGRDRRELEEACLRTARTHGIRFIGPNGIGLVNRRNGLALPFMPLRQDIPQGPVSILAQSGGVGLSYVGFLAEENIGLSKFVSMGNKLDVCENELLAYLIQDEETKIILIYLEGFTDGRAFIEIAARSPKPILVHKSNRFAASARIAHSHTAALSADDTLVDYALEQAGCVRVNTLDDAVDYIKILTLPPLRGKRLAVISRSGGYSVIAVDACAHYGFQLPRFPEAFFKKFEKRFRAHVTRLQNPLDLGDLFELGFYEHIVEEMLKRDDVDGVLLGHGYRRGFEQEAKASRAMLQEVEKLVQRYRKPVAPVILTEAVERDFLKRHLTIPVFAAPENAMRAFNLSHRWASRSPSPMKAPAVRAIDRGQARAVLERARGRDFLLLSESLDLLRAYGFPLAPYALAGTIAEAVAYRRTCKDPVAMKVNRPHVSHKTDAGALKLRLDSEEAVRRAFRELERAMGEGLEVLLQPMVERGREVILGGRQDAGFGPVILFGLGGIFVEALGDVVWRVAPINRREARQMVRAIRGAKILSGLRGEKPCDTRAIEDAVVRLSRLLVDFPQILEIDINPVKAFDAGEGAQALDARVVIRKTGS